MSYIEKCVLLTGGLEVSFSIDCRLEPPFQVRKIYVLRKIPKLVFEKHYFTAIQIAVFSHVNVTLHFGELGLVALFPNECVEKHT